MTYIEIEAPSPPPVVPVSTVPAMSTSAPRKSGSARGGAFAAAAMAARRQMTRDRDEGPTQHNHQPRDARGVRWPHQLDGKSVMSEQQKKSSLNSLKEFVAAPLSHDGLDPEELAEAADDVHSLVSVTNTNTTDIYATSSSRDSYATHNMDTVHLDRLVLGPMDMSSPNRKGSDLVLRAKPSSSEISFEWKQEAKILLTLPFEAISLLQVR